MKVTVVGGGPAGLYFSLLLKKTQPDHDIVVYERNPEGATYGWGVVFSDRTLSSFREADYKTYTQITDSFIIWDSIDVCYRDEVLRCGGQVFSGISRKTLLGLLHARCEELGVTIEHEREVSPGEIEGDLIVAADGVRSALREGNAAAFGPRISSGSSRYIWFGTERTFDSFTFAFRANEHGFFQAHAYPFDGHMSTFIVECDLVSWHNAGLDSASEAESIAYCEALFAKELRGHALRSNRSKWIRFETLRNKRWHTDNLVLIGDAAHTAHFSIGSGTKLAMEDAIALVDALQTKASVAEALGEYQLERKPRVERFQEAARQSQTYFENTRLYQHMEPLQFAFHLLSRSGRIDYDDLRLRDRHFVAAVDRWFTARAAGTDTPAIAAPPTFTPLRLGEREIPNRVAVRARDPDGIVAAARSGAGLVFSGFVAVSEHGRITLETPKLVTPEDAVPWAGAIRSLRVVSGAATVVTLGHSGARGATRPRDRMVDVPLDEAEVWGLLAASPVGYTARSQVPYETGRRHMDDVTEDFVAATAHAAAVGFDMVELHMGHGYLLGSFISPLTNLRTDDYSGPIDARMRFPLEVLDAVRAAWPAERPLAVALNVSDWARGGTTLADAVRSAELLKQQGCDVIRVLAGQTTATYSPRFDPYYLTHYADRIHNEARIATIATGDITTVDHANTIVAGGRADICLLRA
ncbi:MAG TPA: FAD-dependent monooxygenase [Actinomycetota bacterium]|nr:FAD-dependent monooxygenase [Actinomycetota bacterium]